MQEYPHILSALFVYLTVRYLFGHIPETFRAWRDSKKGA